MTVEYSAVNAITFLVGLVFLVNGYRLVRQGREDMFLFLLSAVVGSGLLVVAVFPNVFEVVAALLGLDWKARAILVIANLTLFVLVVYLVSRLAELHNAISRLNEEVSLLKTELEESDE